MVVFENSLEILAYSLLPMLMALAVKLTIGKKHFHKFNRGIKRNSCQPVGKLVGNRFKKRQVMVGFFLVLNYGPHYCLPGYAWSDCDGSKKT